MKADLKRNAEADNIRLNDKLQAAELQIENLRMEIKSLNRRLDKKNLDEEKYKVGFFER